MINIPKKIFWIYIFKISRNLTLCLAVKDGLFKKSIYFTNSFLSSRSIQEIFSHAYGNLDYLFSQKLNHWFYMHCTSRNSKMTGHHSFSFCSSWWPKNENTVKTWQSIKYYVSQRYRHSQYYTKTFKSSDKSLY